MDAKVVGVPPFSEPKSSEMVLPLLPLCCKANRLPSREAFDQGYWVYWHRRLGPAETPAPSLVSLVRPVPSVLTFPGRSCWYLHSSSRSHCFQRAATGLFY